MLLIVGCGDVGVRVARLVAARWRVLALTSTPLRRAELRAAGVVPLLGDLDCAATLDRLAGLADAVLHLAPPPNEGDADPRTAALLRALARSSRLRRFVYGSTSGVYGDCAGARVDETRRIRPSTGRARRRADAERRVRSFGRASGVATTILRIPGIYALDRRGGDPRERLARGDPLLVADEDVHTSHMHADDLARACVAALHRGKAQRIVNVADRSELKMGDWFDLVADLSALPRAGRVSRARAAELLSPMQLSFLGESRRLVARRLATELRVALRYPTVAEALRGPPVAEELRHATIRALREPRRIDERERQSAASSERDGRTR